MTKEKISANDVPLDDQARNDMVSEGLIGWIRAGTERITSLEKKLQNREIQRQDAIREAEIAQRMIRIATIGLDSYKQQLPETEQAAEGQKIYDSLEQLKQTD